MSEGLEHHCKEERRRIFLIYSATDAQAARRIALGASNYGVEVESSLGPRVQHRCSFRFLAFASTAYPMSNDLVPNSHQPG
jgi:hypothetical protein